MQASLGVPDDMWTACPSQRRSMGTNGAASHEPGPSPNNSLGAEAAVGAVAGLPELPVAQATWAVAPGLRSPHVTGSDPRGARRGEAYGSRVRCEQRAPTGAATRTRDGPRLARPSVRRRPP